MTAPKLIVSFLDRGREARQPPDPRYPAGQDIDLAKGAARFCETALPYPARRCGVWLIKCAACGYSALITAAGRRDDPRSARVPCKGA